MNDLIEGMRSALDRSWPGTYVIAALLLFVGYKAGGFLLRLHAVLQGCLLFGLWIWLQMEGRNGLGPVVLNGWTWFCAGAAFRMGRSWYEALRR